MAFYLVDKDGVTQSSGQSVEGQAVRAYLTGPGRLNWAQVESMNDAQCSQLFRGAVAKGWRVLWSDDVQTQGKKFKD